MSPTVFQLCTHDVFVFKLKNREACSVKNNREKVFFGRKSLKVLKDEPAQVLKVKLLAWD